MKSILLVKKLLGLVEMTSGLVNASFSLSEWQAVKMIFFAPCNQLEALPRSGLCQVISMEFLQSLLIRDHVENQLWGRLFSQARLTTQAVSRFPKEGC